MSKSQASFVRPQAVLLARRLKEPRRFILAVAGPRQVGKTTLVQQVVEASGLAARFASADEPSLKHPAWIEQQWEAARLQGLPGRGGSVLVLDEIQKIPGWSETVKRLWDEDTRTRRSLKLIVLGSTPLLVQQGLSESLAGRFEMILLPHWSLHEMKAGFDWTLERYIYYGGYPGAALLVKDPERWRQYVRDSLIETAISRDILLMTRVDKPALLRHAFQLGCSYSGQILSFTKMLGQLQDAGNTVTLAHYLELLATAGMLTGIQKYSSEPFRRRGSSPKLQVFNTALISAQADLALKDARADGAYWGRLVESAVGAHLANAAATGTCELFYWRDNNREVDFVVRAGRRLIAIEVKSGAARAALPGMAAFDKAFKPARKLLVGGDGIPLDEFLTQPVEHWVRD